MSATSCPGISLRAGAVVAGVVLYVSRVFYVAARLPVLDGAWQGSIATKAAPGELSSAAAAPLPVELSVVLPTFKERGNVAELVRRLDAALAGVAWEAIFVDDNSPDGTADAAKAIAARDPRVRCLRRVGRRGLAGACIEGILSSAAPYVAVMDADLQHDERALTAMLATLRARRRRPRCRQPLRRRRQRRTRSTSRAARSATSPPR